MLDENGTRKRKTHNGFQLNVVIQNQTNYLLIRLLIQSRTRSKVYRLGTLNRLRFRNVTWLDQ